MPTLWGPRERRVRSSGAKTRWYGIWKTKEPPHAWAISREERHKADVYMRWIREREAAGSPGGNPAEIRPNSPSSPRFAFSGHQDFCLQPLQTHLSRGVR